MVYMELTKKQDARKGMIGIVAYTKGFTLRAGTRKILFMLLAILQEYFKDWLIIIVVTDRKFHLVFDVTFTSALFLETRYVQGPLNSLLDSEEKKPQVFVVPR